MYVERYILTIHDTFSVLVREECGRNCRDIEPMDKGVRRGDILKNIHQRTQ
jgi:hypothetical protein